MRRFMLLGAVVILSSCKDQEDTEDYKAGYDEGYYVGFDEGIAAACEAWEGSLPQDLYERFEPTDC